MQEARQLKQTDALPVPVPNKRSAFADLFSRTKSCEQSWEVVEGFLRGCGGFSSSTGEAAGVGGAQTALVEIRVSYE